MPRATQFLIPACAVTAIASLFTASWLAAPAEAAQRTMSDASIAVVATPDIMNDLMASDRFAPDRERYAQEKRDELNPLVDQIQKLQQELQNTPQEDERFGALFQQFQRLRQEAAAKQNEINAELERFTAEQVVEAYKLVRSSAQAVAEDLGFDYVMTSANEDEELEPQSVDVALRQIMSRPVLMYPEDADITDDVREDLNIE